MSGTQTLISRFFAPKRVRQDAVEEDELKGRKRRFVVEDDDDGEEGGVEEKARMSSGGLEMFMRKNSRDVMAPRDEERRCRFGDLVGDWVGQTKEREEVGGGENARSLEAKLTPLEEQFVKIKSENPEVLLFVECGYKYRFFGEDAEVVSRVCRIFSRMDHNFMSSSIPTHRLMFYVTKMVRAGYKVGVVRQLETAALKRASDKASGPFVRKLTDVYTAGTFLEDIKSEPSYIAVFHQAEGVVGFVAIDVATRDLVFDELDCSLSFDALDSVLQCLKPVEVLLKGGERGVSRDVSRCLTRYAELHQARVELMKSEDFEGSTPKNVEKFGKICASCVRAVEAYLKHFDLESAVLADFHNSRKFSSMKRLSLGADSLRNFDIFSNSSDGGLSGSLYHFLDKTRSPFGSRMLRQWLQSPLQDSSEIEERQEALDNVRRLVYRSDRKEEGSLPSLLQAIGGLPDIERILSKIQHRRCTPAEFGSFHEGLSQVLPTIEILRRTKQLRSGFLARIMETLPNVQSELSDLVECTLNVDRLSRNEYRSLFKEKRFSYDAGEDGIALEMVLQHSREMKQVKVILDEHLEDVRKLLRRSTMEWKTVAQEEYLVEVALSDLSLIPDTWFRVNQTKTVVRFRTQRTTELLQELGEARERLDAASREAWRCFLQRFSALSPALSFIIRFLGIIDCLGSLAIIASLPGYVKPVIVRESERMSSGMVMRSGRHPVLESSSKVISFVPNDIALGVEAAQERSIVLTGPNMGGKSTFIRTYAVLAIMAQIGSHVPASELIICPFDAIYSRIGAYDCIAKGISTFSMELTEASTILRSASTRSLVIMDELGRGTSTHDGTAIAHATLEHLLSSVGCVTLFVTHYPVVANLAMSYPGWLGSYFMNYLVQEDGKITFLYKATRGVADRSYGLNVARLAGIDGKIVEMAAEHAAVLEDAIKNRVAALDVRSFVHDEA